MLLPNDLRPLTVRFWPPENEPFPTPPADPPRADDISIVTAFFDTGRTSWRAKGGKGVSPYQRSTDQYFGYFSNLAKIKNQIIIFTQPDFAPKVLELRRAAGLEHKTVIFTIADLFGASEIAPAKEAIARRMTDALRHVVYRPECPEYNVPAYVVINGLKTSFICTAIQLGAIEAPQIAWIDFGYCRNDGRFDPAVPWRFDTRGKINLFHIHPLNDTPFFHMIRSGDVYFQGCHMVGPRDAWFPFAHEIGSSLTALLECDLIHHDQPLIWMTWRRSPDAYITHAVHPDDWFVIFRRFNSSHPVEPVTLPRPYKRAPESLAEEMHMALTHYIKPRKALAKTRLKKIAGLFKRS